jgi:subtilisin family serine protease
MDAQDNPGASGTIPLFAVTRRTGMQLWSFFDAQPESIAGTIERYAQGWPAYEDIASFSSFGPTADNRIKPDIVAPGELVSAASGDSDGDGATCNIGRKSGTSMATPMAAGHTAIIRQYFKSGFYPSGAPGNAAYLPSGPLMKAVMLGGACEMQGNTEQYLPLEDSPSTRQGFGRFCLCNALKLAGNCTTNMQVSLSWTPKT